MIATLDKRLVRPSWGRVERANARRLVRTVVTAFPEAFGGAAGGQD